jgi:hypothetical protein
MYRLTSAGDEFARARIDAVGALTPRAKPRLAPP